MPPLLSQLLPFRAAAALLGAALAVLAACAPSGQDPSGEGLDAFAERFREANRSGTVAPMLELYHLEGVDADTRRMLRTALEYELGLPIADIGFEPLSGAPEETIAFEHEGVAYGPTLEPRLRMRVRYGVEDQLSSLFTLGKRGDGAWRIVCAAPRPPPRP
jgi:hypothetical protein